MEEVWLVSLGEIYSSASNWITFKCERQAKEFERKLNSLSQSAYSRPADKYYHQWLNDQSEDDLKLISKFGLPKINTIKKIVLVSTYQEFIK